jgi:outer membrane protein
MRVCSALPRCVLLTAGILGLILTSITLSFPVIAQDEPAPAQEKAKQSDSDGIPPLPLSPIEKAQKDGTALPISLKEITRLALQQNLDIAIQDTNQQTSREKVKGSKGPYDPSLRVTTRTNSSKSASSFKYEESADPFTKQDNASVGFTFNQKLKTGGSFSATWDSSRSESNLKSSVTNPNNTSSWNVQFTQPLWQNLKIDQNRVSIITAKLDLTTSESQFKQKVTDVISNIQSSYWDLVSAIRNYEIRRNSVKLAQINLRDNRKKVEVGTIAPIEVTDAEATAAAREVDLISAEETILRAENTLRQFISSDRNADIWTKILIPTDLPDFKEYKVDLDIATNNAMKNRPELEQAKISLEQLDVSTRLTRNDRKWLVELTSQYGTSGSGGSEGLNSAYKRLFTDGYANWSVGFNVTIPLRTTANDAQLAQREISKRQQLLTLRKQEQSIQVEIRNALQTLESNRKQVDSAGIARKLAAERLSGEQKRFEAGLSQNYLVLQRQNELSSQEYAELQALIRYKQAIITLQKAMYTLLEANDFEIAKGIAVKSFDLK